jgi:RNAse (barnase) inhibitor barstar
VVGTAGGIGYEVIDDDSELVLIQARDVRNFYTSHTVPEDEAVLLRFDGWQAVGCDPAVWGAKADLGNVWIVIRDHKGRRIGRYYMSVATGYGVKDDGSLELGGMLVWRPGAGSEAMWTERRRCGPMHPGSWLSYTGEQRDTWLEISANHWDATHSSRNDDPTGTEYELDGRVVGDLRDFLCAIGEAINGPGGYFGRSLSALADCLGGDYGATTPFTLDWRYSSESRERLKGDFGRIMEVLSRCDVRLL